MDFDRGSLRRPGLWCDSNLVRLRRSIEKIADALPPERFSEADWASLLSGYFAVPPRPRRRNCSAAQCAASTRCCCTWRCRSRRWWCWRAACATREYWRGWRQRFGFGPRARGRRHLGARGLGR